MFVQKFRKLTSRQIVAAQNVYNARLLADCDFAYMEAAKPYNACLSEWFPPKDPNEEMRVLELGCGPGRYLSMLHHFPCTVVGVDPFYFDYWKVFKNHKNIELMPGIKAEALPFENETFNFIVCLGALLYFENPALALNQMHRVLKKKGRVLLRTVNANNLYSALTGKKLDPDSKNLYTKDQLETLIRENGFLIRNYFSFGFWPPIFPNFYWYISNCFLTFSLHTRFSRWLPEKFRINHIFFLEKI